MKEKIMITMKEQAKRFGAMLEYKNPANLTLRELMNLAEGQVDFERQENGWRKKKL